MRSSALRWQDPFAKIAAPNTSKGQIVFKWPDHNIRKFSRCIVEPDAVAVFMSQGQVMGTLLGGQHQLDAKELPFLGMFVDWATGSNAFKAELYFVGIRDFPNMRFAECGTPMQQHCTSCNASLSPGAKFCAECGTPAHPPAS